MRTNPPEIMTVEEVAAYLRVSEKTVYGWAKNGEIPCGKLGAAWRFLRQDVEDWVSARLGPATGMGQKNTVRVEEALSPERIRIWDGAVKSEALTDLVDTLATAPEVRDRDALLSSIQHRESLLSTGLGLGVAVPHARLTGVNDVVMAVGVSRKDISGYETLDNRPVRIVFMVAAGAKQHAEYLSLMSTLSSMIKDEEFRDSLLRLPSPPEIYRMMTNWPARAA